MREAQTHALGQKKEYTFRGNGNMGRHSWLRLTPAYSLHVVKALLACATTRDKVLDPFSGTGTTPLVCATLGIPAHAVDINQFLVWLGNLKLHGFASQEIRAFKATADRLVDDMARGCQGEANAWLPDLHQIEKWWDKEHLGNMARLFALIESAHKTKHVESLLKLAFCRVMIEFANVTFGHQSMSFKRKPRQDMLFDNALDVAAAFAEAAADIAESLADPLENTCCRVYVGDSRDLGKVLPDSDYSKVITSPPYPNRMSYIRELRPYMYWLGFLQNGRQAGELDWQAIGGTWGCATSQLKDWRPRDDRPIPYKPFAAIVSQIGERHALLGAYVAKYFYDMRQHVESLKGVLAPNARCHYVVGNSKFYETLLPTEEIFAALFEASGYHSVSITTLRKRTSKKELFEYVVEATR